jgi:hypothetical protein
MQTRSPTADEVEHLSTPLTLPEVRGATSLRRELSHRNQSLAKSENFLHALTDGQVPGVIFGQDDAGRHGNFHPASYQRICANHLWAARLTKVHTAYKKIRARADWRWMELDCGSSSDALLMNIFCHPQTFADGRVSALLGIGVYDTPEFGFKPRVPLHGKKYDRTEIDMRLGPLYVEAKLTEGNFQQAKRSLVDRYRDLSTVFETDILPASHDISESYQLVRSVLAAYADGVSFCVLCDSRRPDLIEAWYRILRAVRSGELRCRLKLLTWQELASALPQDLQQYLQKKYGITAA